MKLPMLLVGLLFGMAVSTLADEVFPRPELLAEPNDVASPGSAKPLIVLDARPQAQYELGHIPGAQWVDPAAWAKEFGNGSDNAGWSRKIGQLGITANSQVIVYDDSSTKDAARIWWILRFWGVKDARLLNGGWSGWVNGKFPIETKRSSPTAPVEFEAKADSHRLITKKQLLERLNDKQFQIVDARSEKEFCGVEKMTNKRAGAIPGAKQLEWIDLIDKQTHRFKNPSELRKVFHDAGIDLDRPTATHCQSGGRAAVMAFGMELMGTPDVKNYYASWSEWGNADDTPVVTGTPKAKK